MSMNICGAPSCWGVDDPKNPYLPPWTRVLSEASQAGYRAIELGPWGYIPNDVDLVAEELNKNGLGIVVGTIFHDLVTPENQPSVLKAVDDICKLITDPKMPKLPVHEGQKWPTPYLTVMDWGHDERDFNAGHSDRAPRMDDEQWAAFVKNVRAVCDRANSWGVRPVIHPHAGTYIEFADEIDGWVIDAIKAIGIDTAKAVLNAPREMLIEKTDLEEETVDEVIRILKSEFEEEESEEEPEQGQE